MTNYLTMDEVVKKYSHIKIATEEDNQKILEFYKNEAMVTDGESISFARDPNFFDFYRLTTNTFWTFLFLNDDLSIGGIGSVLRHERRVGEEIKPLAYFCDLRISHKAGRRAKIQWRQFFPDIIESLPKLAPEYYCISAYTAILASNDAAINSLTKGGRGITYRYLNSYLVNSFVTTGLLHSKLFYAEEITIETFLKFYQENNAKIFLSEEKSSLQNTISKLSSFSKESNLVGVFKNGTLVSVSFIVNKNITRRLKVNNLSGAKMLATKLLKVLGKPTPSKDGELQVVDFLYYSLDEKFESFEKEILEAYSEFLNNHKINKKAHTINIINDNKIDNMNILNNGISFITKGHLFEIHPENGSGILPNEKFRFEGALL